MPEPAHIGLVVCSSGRHAWIDPGSAERCCNGWRRQLVVACPGLGEELPAGASSVSTVPGARCGFVWVPASDTTTTR